MHDQLAVISSDIGKRDDDIVRAKFKDTIGRHLPFGGSLVT
jgi:hypothetical protein